MNVRHPPGRAGRVWLRSRVDAAARAATLLEQKERVLVREQRRLAVLARHTEAEWEAACAEALPWVARATALRGRQAVDLGAAVMPAAAELRWRNSMGAYYPAEASCQLPPSRPLAALTGTVAMREADRAHRHALGCAVQHAATRRAVAEVDRELRATRQRLRMIKRRWVPALREAQHVLDLALEDEERDDIIRVRSMLDSEGGAA
jgi:V/A-type H+/Na+-transporting ATPase subunit D